MSSRDARCRFAERCPMYPIFESRHILRIYQIQYCESRFENCERFKLASRGEMPDPQLLPDGDRLSPRERE
ncbi:MAG TPA: hypothetical protein ENI85_17290 [Deltaproteobacteria bacterium]|nr:hypothetical protein [Deltaproteobacteria bacterium]